MNACLKPNVSTDIEQRFLDFVAAPDFPCVGAKTALSRGNIRFVVAGDLRSSACDTSIAHDLQRFATDTDKPDMFVSMVVLFGATPPLSERLFEQALWQRLQAIHEIDTRRFAWDSRVDDDPASPDFAFSIGGQGFFVIGLHPGASRKARRFERPALVFNLHSQFELLRADGRFDIVSRINAKRDRAFSGSVNPMLARYGESSDALQYSGRQVNGDWHCPFHARKASTPDDP